MNLWFVFCFIKPPTNDIELADAKVAFETRGFFFFTFLVGLTVIFHEALVFQLRQAGLLSRGKSRLCMTFICLVRGRILMLGMSG